MEGGINIMNAVEIKKLTKSWDKVSHLLSYPKNQKEVKDLIKFMDELLDEIGDNEIHPLIKLLDTVSLLVEVYEDKHVQIGEGSGVDSLKYLMESRGVKQIDLKKELGSQGIVSQILSGKRKLNLRQIKVLSEKFNVNPSVFID